MIKCFIILLSIVFLSGCIAYPVEDGSESYVSVHTAESPISTEIFSEVFTDNEDIFSEVQNQISEIPINMYTVTNENDEIYFWDSLGQRISVENIYNKALFVDLFSLMGSFADDKIKNNSKIFISKNEHEIKFIIRDMDLYIDYSIVYVYGSLKNKGENTLYLKSSWYAEKYGLV